MPGSDTSFLVREAYTRLREELVRHTADFDDPALASVTVTLKMDRRSGHIGAVLWRPEFERTFREAPPIPPSPPAVPL